MQSDSNTLSKTDLLSLRQCPRKLWLEKHFPEDAPIGTSSQERRTMDGHLVNEQARKAVGPAFIWPASHDDPAEAMAQALDSLSKSPTSAVVEMPMYRDGLYCRADALEPVEGGYALRETKSSTFPLKTDKVTPAKPKEHFVEDVVIQAWAAEATNLPIVDYELNLLNSKWTYHGDGDYKGLFRHQNLNTEVAKLKAQVPIWLNEAREVIKGEMPQVTMGRQCKNPYDCPFVKKCKAMEPEGVPHPVELLPDLAGKNLAAELRRDGYASIVDVPDARFEGTRQALYLRIKSAHATGKVAISPGAKAILTELPYPRYYFDFEGIDLPVPRWDGVRPYEQIPFQWSCHIEHAPNVFEHKAFLDVSGSDPSLACVERMREVIKEDDNGPILVYYQTYEKSRLKELAERHPQFEALMQGYIDRLVDLHPIIKDHYYHPDMKGSFSIKKVLPTIASDLKYDDLEDIQDGTGAQIGYLHATFSGLQSDARESLVKNALAYCEQDTWAMVLLSFFLEERLRPIKPEPDLSPLSYLQAKPAKKQAMVSKETVAPKSVEAVSDLEDLPF